MKGGPGEFKEFSKRFKPRVIWPNPEDPKLLSGRLRKLTQEQHVATAWIQNEIFKLLPDVATLERAPATAAGLGFLAGVGLMGIVLLVHIGVSGS